MTEPLPEVEHDSDVLLRLSNAATVLRSSIQAAEAEANAAAQSAIDANAAHLARCRSVVYQLIAEAHELGFSSVQIDSVLGQEGGEDGAWRHI